MKGNNTTKSKSFPLQIDRQPIDAHAGIRTHVIENKHKTEYKYQNITYKSYKVIETCSQNVKLMLTRHHGKKTRKSMQLFTLTGSLFHPLMTLKKRQIV